VTITANLADGRVLNFPDGTDPQVIQATVKKMISPAVQPQAFNEDLAGLPGVQVDPNRQAPEPTAPKRSTVSRLSSELAGGINQGVIDLLDFVTTDQFNAISSLVGSEVRVPSIESTKFGQVATARPQERSTVGDILRATGEVIPAAVTGGGLIRATAKTLPALGAASESAGAGVLRQLGTGGAGTDVALGGISGAGGEVGEKVGGAEGQLIGAIAAPLGAMTLKSSISGLLQSRSATTSKIAKLIEEGSADISTAKFKIPEEKSI